MKKIDIEELRREVETKHDPFDFYLFLTISNDGHIDNDNPYIDDLDFLKTLLNHYEAEENYELCAEIRRKIKDLV